MYAGKLHHLECLVLSCLSGLGVGGGQTADLREDQPDPGTHSERAHFQRRHRTGGVTTRRHQDSIK